MDPPVRDTGLVFLHLPQSVLHCPTPPELEFWVEVNPRVQLGF